MGILFAIAVGGAIGAVLRFTMVSWVTNNFEHALPLGTLAVNVVGAFLIGILMVSLQARVLEHEWLRYLLVVGLLGGFTTFSAFSLDTYVMFESGAHFKAMINIVLNVVLCIFATTSAIWLSRHVFH